MHIPFLLLKQGQRIKLIELIKKEITSIIMKLDIQRFVCGIYFRDLTKKDDNFQDIWDRIKGLAPHQSQWEIQVPAQWILMERDIQQLAREGIPVIKYRDLLDIASRNAYSPNLFVKYMRTSGLMLTLKPGQLEPGDDIVIDPQWLIDAFRQVIDFDDNLSTTYGSIQSIVQGELTKEDAQKVWQDFKFRDKTNLLLKFMENLGLIAKPRNENVYYIPSLLDGGSCEDEIRKWVDINKRFVSKAIVLDFRRKSQQLPFPHFDKMMAEFISKQTKESLMFVKRNVCIAFMEDLPLGFVLCYRCSVLKITIFTNARTNEAKVHMSRGHGGWKLYQTILNILKEISVRFNQQITVPSVGISCNAFCPVNQKPIAYIKVAYTSGQKCLYYLVNYF